MGDSKQNNKPRLAKGISRTKYCYRVSYRNSNGKYCSSYFPLTPQGYEDAKKFKADVAYKKAHGIPLDEEKEPEEYAGVVTVSMAMLDWVAEKKIQGNQLGWVRDWVSIFNKIVLPKIGQKDITKVKYKDIAEIIADNWADKSPSTKNRYVSYLKGMFNEAIKREYIEKNPLDKWKHLKENRRRSPITVEGLKKLEQNAEPHLAWLLRVAWRIPVRPGKDLFGLRFEQVDYQKQGIQVRHTKTKQHVFIPLSDSFLAELKEREKVNKSGYIIEYKGKPLTHNVKRSFATAAKDAGVEINCLYDLRHLWISTMIHNGENISTLAAMAGTSTRMIHANYLERTKDFTEVANNIPDVFDKPKNHSNVVQLRKRKKK